MDNQQLFEEDFEKSRSQKVGRSMETLVPSQIEGFDGVRKNNSKKIFGILLIIIVIDFGIELISS